MKSPFTNQGTSRASLVTRWLVILLVWAASRGAAAEYTFVNIADSATAAPFGLLTYFGQPASSGATVVFEGGNNVGDGLFTGSGGPLTDIVKIGDPAPSGTFYTFQSNPSIDGGKVAFQAFFNNDGNDDLRAGIFTS